MSATFVAATEIPDGVDHYRAAFARVDPIPLPIGIELAPISLPYKVSILGKFHDGWRWATLKNNERDWVGDTLIEAGCIGQWMLLPDFFSAAHASHKRLAAAYDAMPPGCEPEDFKGNSE